MTKKNKTKLRILQVSILSIIFISFLPGIFSAGQIVFTDDESRIWGFTYHLLGVDWSAYMQNDSLISFGYSLILTPICSLLEKPGAIYKILVLSNAVITCIAYLLSVHVSSKLFPESDKVVLTLACGLAVLCPGLALAKISAVPDMLLLLFIWLDIAIITKLDKNPSTRMLLEFVLVLGLGIMFHAAMILPAIAGGIYLYHLEKKEKISGRQLVFLGTVLIIIVASIQGVESFWLNSIMKGTEYQSKTALGSFIYGMVVNWDIEGFTKFLQSLIGKIFNFGTGTLLFGLLGVFFLIRRKSEVNRFLVVTIFLVLAGTTLYYQNGSTGDSILNSRILFSLAGPFILAGIIILTEKKEWLTLTVWCFFIMLFATVYTGVNVNSYAQDTMKFCNSGLLFQGLADVIASLKGCIYLIGFVVVIFFFVGISLIKATMHAKRREKVVHGVGIILFLGISIIYSFVMQKMDVMDENADLSANAAEIISVYKETAGELPFYYHAEGKEQDKELCKLQYQMGNRQIFILNENAAKEKSEKDLENLDTFEECQEQGGGFCLLTSAKDIYFDQYDEKYALVNLNSEFAFFMKKNSDEALVYQNALHNRIYEMSLDQEDDWSLQAGTYEWTIEVKADDKSVKEGLTVSILSGKRILAREKIVQEQEENGIYRVGMVLTTGKYLKDVSVQVSGGQEILRSIYRNVSHEFSYGMDDTDHFQKVANKIQKIDSSQKKTIGVLRDHYTGENIDLEFMNKCLEGYGTHIIEAGEKASDDYLISTERGRSYYLYLDEYSILEKNDSYVLLGKVDEKTQKDWERQGISVLSDEYRLCMDNFDPKRKGKVTSIELESGNYNYVFLAKREDKGKVASEKEAELVLKNGNDKVIGLQTITQSDFNESGEAIITVPLAVRDSLKKLTYEIKGDLTIAVEPQYIEMTSDKYQVGSNNPEAMDQFTQIIQENGMKAPVYYVTSMSRKNQELFTLSDMQKELSDYEVKAVTQSEAKYAKVEVYLIFDEFTSSVLDFAKYFTLVAQEGNYSLWVTKEGALTRGLLEKGIPLISYGSKVPVSVLYDLNRNADEQERYLGEIKKGSYEFTVSLRATEIKDSKVAVLQVIGMETGDEEDSENLESLYREEVVEAVEITSDQLEEGYRKVITVKADIKEDMDQLEIRMVPFGDNIVDMETEWIEKR